MKTILLKIQLNDLKEECTRSCTEYDIYKDGYIQKEKSLGMPNKQLEIANISSEKLRDIKILKTDNKTLVFEIYVIDSKASFSFKCKNTNCRISNESLIIYNYSDLKTDKED